MLIMQQPQKTSDGAEPFDPFEPGRFSKDLRSSSEVQFSGICPVTSTCQEISSGRKRYLLEASSNQEAGRLRQTVPSVMSLVMLMLNCFPLPAFTAFTLQCSQCSCVATADKSK